MCWLMQLSYLKKIKSNSHHCVLVIVSQSFTYTDRVTTKKKAGLTIHVPNYC